jgi:hypothetical protein
MSDARPDLAPPPPSGQPLPLEHFLDALRREGFAVDADHYHELPLLLHTLAPEYPYEALKTLLAPLFVRNRQEQRQFYEFFERYFTIQPPPRRQGTVSPPEPPPIKKTEAPAPPPKAAPRFGNWPYWLGAIALLAALSLVGMGTEVQQLLAALKAGLGFIPILLSLAVLCLIGFYAFHKIARSRLKGRSTREPGWVLLALPTGLFFWAGYYAAEGGVVMGTALALLALVFFLTLNEYFARRFRPAPPVPPPAPRLLTPLRFPPEVPFPQLDLVGRTEAFHLSRQLNRLQADTYDTREIDIPATLERTLRQAGVIDIAFQPITEQPRYLLLIDAAQANEHEVEWFDYLLQVLQGDDTRLERYFFEYDPSFCWHEPGAAPVPLQNLYGGQRLIVLSDGYLLADLASGGLFNWALDLFSLWTEKAILSYRPVEEWGYVEQQLATEFYLAPSTVDGLMEAVDFFENRAEKSLEDWHRDNLYDVLNTDDVALLRRSLPPEVFAWVAACALHPELYWQLTLHLGELLEPRPGILLNQEHLTLLSRLKWFREGNIPAPARRELSRVLPTETQLQVRRALVAVLAKPGSVPPRASFALRQYRLSLLRHQFELARLEGEEERAAGFFRQLQLAIAEQGSLDQELLELTGDEALVSRYGLPLGGLKDDAPPLWPGQLRQPPPGQLRWVFYRQGESLRIADYLPERLAAGREKILLLLPGAGDSRPLAEFARLPYLEGEFGLVLTFEYNRLGQPLEESARQLQNQLQSAGLETAAPNLTILAHSTGGLVARYYLEHLGGNINVNHLVLVGTPNGGSSTLQAANRLWKVMESASSTIPLLGSYFAVLLSRLYLRFFPAYQQIEPGSAFIQSLNPAPDQIGFHSNVLSMQKAVFDPGPYPGLPYSILAGDAEAYYRVKKLSRGERWVLKLAARLYQGQPHDLAASVESMTRGSADWQPRPIVRQVPATHSTYFAAPESVQALRELLQRDLSIEVGSGIGEEAAAEMFPPEEAQGYEAPEAGQAAEAEALEEETPEALSRLRDELNGLLASPEAGPSAAIRRLRDALQPYAALHEMLDVLQDRLVDLEKRWLGRALSDTQYQEQSAALAAELRGLIEEGLRVEDLREEGAESVAESVPPETESMSSEEPLDRMDSLPARWMLASGRVGIAEKPEEQRVSFLQLVLTALRENQERRLSASDLRDILQLVRPTDAPYEPTGGPLPEAGDEGGQFFFYDKNERRASAPSKRPQRQGSSGNTGQRGQAWLFVVGISEYRHLPPVPGAAREVQELTELLLSKYQFERDYLYQFYDAEATRTNILRNLKRIVSEALPEDEVLIIFAGHSDRPPRAEQGYWLPHDAQRGRLASYISREDIFHDLRMLAPRQVLVVVDGEGW